MPKNSHILSLSLFGTGLIISTSPLFALLDSSYSETKDLVNVNGNSEEGELAEEKELEEQKQELTEESVQLEKNEVKNDLKEEEKSILEESKDVAKDNVEASSEPSIKQEPATTHSEEPKDSSIPSEEKKEVDLTPTEKTASETTTPPTPDKSKPSSETTQDKSKKQAKKQTNSRATISISHRRTPRTIRPYIKDYESKKRTESQGVYSVTTTSKTSHYLYSYDKNLAFNLPTNHQEYQKIKKENIKISLFKNPVWNTENKRSDEYQELTKENKEELFKKWENGDVNRKKRFRQILLSLSNRREWKFHGTETYTSELRSSDIIGSESGDSKDNEWELKLKYFKEFKELDEYLEEKMKKCTSDDARGQCLAKPEELTIIDQDKTNFFSKK